MEKDIFKADDLNGSSEISIQNSDISSIALDAAGLGTWVIDIKHKVFQPSSYTESLFGVTQGSLNLQELINIVEYKYRQKVQDALDSAIKNKLALLLEFPIKTSDTSNQKWIRMMGGVTSNQGSLCYLSGITMDITVQKLNDLRKEKLIVMVSHELKTPLTVVKGYIQLLSAWAKQQKDAFGVGALSTVEKQIKKMANMINRFLNLSGAEAGTIQLNKQEFILDDLIREVIDESLLVAGGHKVELQECPQVKVLADREKMEQVLVNLIGNAAKYSNRDTPIKISCKKSGRKVQVIIQDEGMGISKENVAKIFDPHFRVESKETENIKGFGIGLYLTLEILKSHGGTIEVESELGKGSTFTFSIPVGKHS